MNPYRLTDLATSNLEEIKVRIAADNPARADSFIDEFFQRFDLASSMPRAWPQLPLGKESERYIPLGNYIITYEITASDILVTRVFHSALDVTSPQTH